MFISVFIDNNKVSSASAAGFESLSSDFIQHIRRILDGRMYDNYSYYLCTESGTYNGFVKGYKQSEDIDVRIEFYGLNPLDFKSSILDFLK